MGIVGARHTYAEAVNGNGEVARLERKSPLKECIATCMSDFVSIRSSRRAIWPGKLVFAAGGPGWRIGIRGEAEGWARAELGAGPGPRGRGRRGRRGRGQVVRCPTVGPC